MESRLPRRYPCPGRSQARPPPDCPFCYENLRRRSNHAGHRYYVSPPKPKYVPWSSYMQRPTSLAAPNPGDWSCPDAWFFKKYPTLAAHLCDPWWDDGKRRKLSSLSVRFEGDKCNLCLACKETNSGAYTTAVDLQTALALMEKALETGTLSWRRFDGGKK